MEATRNCPVSQESPRDEAGVLQKGKNNEMSRRKSGKFRGIENWERGVRREYAVSGIEALKESETPLFALHSEVPPERKIWEDCGPSQKVKAQFAQVTPWSAR